MAKQLIDSEKVQSVVNDWISKLLAQGEPKLPATWPFGGTWGSNPYATYPFSSAGDNMLYPFEQYARGTSDFDISNILASLTAQSGNLNEDLAVQFANKYLEWIMTMNQRDYDANVTQSDRDYQQELISDQRAYESPSAQISRLMQAGLSRGAALEMLNSGNAAANPIPSQQGSIKSSPIDSDMVAQAQRKGQLISSIALQLVGFGFGAIGAAATRSLTAAQAVAQQQANEAQNRSALLNQHIYNAQKSGLVNTEGATFDNIIGQLEGITKQQSPEIYDFMHDANGMSKLMGTPGAYQISSDNYNTRFGNVNATNVARQLQYQADAAALQPDAIQQSILRSSAEIEKIYSDIDFQNLEIDFAEKSQDTRLGLLDSQLENVQADTRQKNANASMSEIQGKISAISLHRMQLTAKDMDATAMLHVARELQIAQTLGSKQAMDVFCRTILSNQQYQNSLAVFNCLRMNDLESLVKSNPELLQLHNVISELDLGGIFYDYVKNSQMSKSEAAKYTDFINSFGKQLIGAKFANPLMSNPLINMW